MIDAGHHLALQAAANDDEESAPEAGAAEPLVGRQSSQGPPPPLQQPGLFQEIPSGVWALFLAAWATFFLLLLAFFAVNRGSGFAVTIAALFALMAFGLPIVMARQCKGPDCPPIEVVQTYTGPLTVRAAAAQIALIPVAVVIGLLGFILLAK